MHTPTRRLRAATLVATAALVLAACADDDDGLLATPSAPSATPTPTAAATVDDFCEAKLAIDEAFLSGGPPEEEGATPSPEEIGQELSDTFSEPYAELERTAQGEVADDVDALVAALESAIDEGNEEFFFEPEFVTAESAVDEYLVENCGYEELTVTGTDFEFDGLPTSTPGGKTSITLTNEGEEFHEIVLLPINDDVDLSAEELLALPEEEAMTMTGPPSAVTLVTPGNTATSFADLADGRYIVVCFTSKDSTAENDFNGDGPPHFTEGMFEELIVGDAPTGSPSPTSTSSSSGSSSSGSGSSSGSESGSTATTRPTSSPTSASSSSSTS